ncbi:sensor histidine kinase [Persicitalea jodogahamensis]|uniref:Signal transduction histidine kinase internal region domain-containing protein n=1 Tax=Persicitalea jodogahamensis TaxID=402147 RepID=A0A8J3DAA0_9BACT|nr:histidine kinase [Persicitalea jodogahamensis]GHB75343.1 hypothetical protein GCM10007390_31350 [Persicitalea jodogahamensis]
MSAFQISIPEPWSRLTKQFRWQLLVVLPWFIPLITYLLLGASYFSHWRIFVGSTLLNTSLAVGCQVVLDSLTRQVVDRYPGLHQTVKRLLLLLAVFMFVTPIFILGAIWGYTYFHWFGYVAQPGAVFRIFLFNVVANIVSVGVFESIYSLTKWRENMLEKEQLKKANLQSQYESLKNQVNPHFLFNTLNSLSSLIADEPERAEEFVDELAKVYRYLLQTNRNTTDQDGELTTLDTELGFIQSYFHLLKTRYGAGIELELAIEEADRASLLPPLTLQMLVENAVKHNITHASKPLRIEIKSSPGGYLLVRNNLQRKANRVLSNQVGLNNIKAKYQLLAQRHLDPSSSANDIITIEETNDHFALLLPLLN